jgi:hypothetical protein
VELAPGDALGIEGVPDAGDPASLDYIELTPTAPVTSSASQ